MLIWRKKCSLTHKNNFSVYQSLSLSVKKNYSRVEAAKTPTVRQLGTTHTQLSTITTKTNIRKNYSKFIKL